jgi:hypothetical protein
MPVISAEILSHHLKPLCPRDNHVMNFESRRTRSDHEHQPSYHCGFNGCSVRYDLTYGYHTLIGIDDYVYGVEEPGVNTLKCPVHDRWLYRQINLDFQPGVRWRCGVDGCDYCFDASTKGDWVRT